MKNLTKLATVAVVGLIILLSGCAALDTTLDILTIFVPDEQTKPKTLSEKQAEILNCSSDYVDCLDRTRTIKGDFDKFDSAVNKCVEKANNCSGR